MKYVLRCENEVEAVHLTRSNIDEIKEFLGDRFVTITIERHIGGIMRVIYKRDNSDYHSTAYENGYIIKKNVCFEFQTKDEFESKYEPKEVIDISKQPINDICVTCDTRCRLGVCKGKSGNFKYCYRKTGSMTGLKESITPFNEVSELYEKLDYIIPGTLKIQEYSEEHLALLMGTYQGTDDVCPVGFITK